MVVIRNDLVIDTVQYAYSDNVDFEITGIDQGSLQIDYTDDTVATPLTFAAADVDIDLNTVTIAAHGLKNGQKIALTTDGALPAGLTATDYYMIVVDATTLKFGSSLANAKAGTGVNLTDVGGASDTQTITPAAISSSGIALKTSNDGVTYSQAYAAEIKTGAITVSGGKLWDLTDKLNFKFMRIELTLASGVLGLKARLFGKKY